MLSLSMLNKSELYEKATFSVAAIPFVTAESASSTSLMLSCTFPNSNTSYAQYLGHYIPSSPSVMSSTVSLSAHCVPGTLFFFYPRYSCWYTLVSEIDEALDLMN